MLPGLTGDDQVFANEAKLRSELDTFVNDFLASLVIQKLKSSLVVTTWQRVKTMRLHLV